MTVPISRPSQENEDEDDGPIFVNDTDVLEEYDVDEEDLPDIDEGADDGGDGTGGDWGGGHGGDAGGRVRGNDDFDMDESDTGFPEQDDSVHAFFGHTGPVYSVAFSPTDADLVATGGGDDVAFLWRVGDAESHEKLQGHTDSIGSLAFSHDGQLLASGGLDGFMNVWDTAAGTLKHKLEGPVEAIEWVKWHPRGHLVLAGSEDATAWLWYADGEIPTVNQSVQVRKMEASESGILGPERAYELCKVIRFIPRG